MADRNEAESADESSSAAHPEQPGDDVTGPTDEVSAEDSAELEEHVAPDDAREPTVEELEQLLEGDDTDDSEDSDDSGDPDDSGDLVSVGAAPAGRTRTAAGGDGSTSASAGARAKARGKKDKATPRQKRDVEKHKRTTPVSFTKEAVGELRKVVYPTAPQLGNYFVVVLVFVLIIIAFVGGLDVGFGWLIVKIFG